LKNIHFYFTRKLFNNHKCYSLTPSRKRLGRLYLQLAIEDHPRSSSVILQSVGNNVLEPCSLHISRHFHS
jgi:hypothetical protein